MHAAGMQVAGTMEVGALLVLGTLVAAATVVVGMPAVGISIKILQLKCKLPMLQETWKSWRLASQAQSRRLKLARTTTHLQTSALCRQTKASRIGMPVPGMLVSGVAMVGAQVAGVAVVGTCVPMAPGTLVAATLVVAGTQQVGT